MSRVVTSDATMAHIRALASCLRPGDLAELRCMGLKPMAALVRSWRRSLIRRYVTVDGEPAAMWGVAGNLFAPQAVPWLLTSPAVEKVPLAFLKEARAGMGAALDIWPKLVNYVHADYAQSLRFLAMLGFEIDDPEAIEGHLFRKVVLERG